MRPLPITKKMTNYNPKSDKEWWTQQWIDLLNSYRYKKRLERARNYARQGNVLSIDFKDQKITAKVQGTAPEPYELSLWLNTFSDEDWDYVIKTMSERAIFTAKLLAGEMPQNIEEVFSANGLRLFPFALDEVHSRCGLVFHHAWSRHHFSQAAGPGVAILPASTAST
jgi:uncharacterized Zn finger protein